MRPRRHWTPRYVFNRLRVEYDHWRCPDAPWLSVRAREFLTQWLKPTDVGIEWGSGRSTIWFAARVRRLVSVEHDRRWYERTRRELDGRRIINVSYYLRPVDVSPTSYVLAGATEQEVARFDFALVDGELRDECAARAIDLLRPGGLLVIDNANWYLPHQTHSPASIGVKGRALTEQWEAVAARLEGWRALWVSNGVTDTAFFIKQDQNHQLPQPAIPASHEQHSDRPNVVVEDHQHVHQDSGQRGQQPGVRAGGAQGRSGPEYDQTG